MHILLLPGDEANSHYITKQYTYCYYTMHSKNGAIIIYGKYDFPYEIHTVTVLSVLRLAKSASNRKQTLLTSTL